MYLPRFKAAMAAVAMGLLTYSVAGAAGVSKEKQAQIKQVFEERFSGLEAGEIRETGIKGLYEVQVDTDIVYVDEDVNYLVQGRIMDANTRTDLTAERVQKLSEVPFESLPLELAVKLEKGDGSRKVAVFEDPNCPYCKQLHKSFNDIDNVSVYFFQFPILSADSRTKARDILCSDNQAEVLRDWMLNGKTPDTNECDNHSIDEVLKLGTKLMVRGTPAIFFSDGSRTAGALPAAQLKEKLDNIN